MAIKGRINTKGLMLVVNKAVAEKSLPIARRMAVERFENAKEEFLEKLENDKVSQELLAENSITNSEFITGASADSHGASLYGFLGFDKDGNNPVSELLAFLRSNITIKKNVRLINGFYKFPVKVPSVEEVKSVTKLPWIGRSWISAIENGMANIRNYIRVSPNDLSRSDEAFQIKGDTDKVMRRRKGYLTSKLQSLISSLTGKK
jgi:hypothetical protein